MTESGGDREPVPAEPPVGVGARGGHRELPCPRQPSSVSTWGWRAALVAPVGLGGLKLVDLRGQPLPPLARALIVFCLAVLLVGSVHTWRAAGTPRLRYQDVLNVYRGIPHEQRRIVHRALRRREPLPPELRAEATSYLWASRSQIVIWFAVTLGGGNLMPNNRLLENVAFLTLVTTVAGFAVVGTAVLTMLDRRLLARARELGLPLEPETESVSTDWTSAP